MVELRRYVTENGVAPFNAWMKQLEDSKLRAIVEMRLTRVRSGLMGDCRAIGQSVIEFRIDIGPGYRVYAGRHGMQLIVLLAGGTKRSQRHDIELARAYWEDWKKRRK